MSSSPKPTGGWSVPRIVVGLLAVDVLLVVAHVTHALAGFPLGGYVKKFFELELEQNLPTWFASMQLAGAAALLGVLVVFELRQGSPRAWRPLAVAALLLLMSLDEVAEIHEKLGSKSDALLPGGTRMDTSFPYTGIWMFLFGLPFLLGVTALFSRLMRRQAIGVDGFRKIFWGFLVLIAGAGGVEVWANFTYDTPGVHLFQVALEEGLELIGGTLMVWGAIEVLAANGVRLVHAPTGGWRQQSVGEE